MEPSPVSLSDNRLKRITTVSAVALDFDFMDNDPSKFADQIKVLIIKNKRPSRHSKEGKPGGRGLPTGQVEQNEPMLKALGREVRQESGFEVQRVIGELFVVDKIVTVDDQPVPNDIHLFLIVPGDLAGKVIELDEIDASVDPWISLREVFSMPTAQGKYGRDKNPNGIYHSHRQRLYRTIESIVFSPSDFIDGETISNWITPEQVRYLYEAMCTLQLERLIDQFLPFAKCSAIESAELVSPIA